MVWWHGAKIAPFAYAEPFVKIVDLSRELYHRTPSYPGHPPVMHGVWKTHEESFAESGNVHGLASMFISMVDHAGTHIDAPRHFGKSGISIDEYPVFWALTSLAVALEAWKAHLGLLRRPLRVAAATI